MTLSLLFRSALLQGGEAISPALGTAEKQLLATPEDPAAMACKGVLLGMLACHGQTGNRDSYAPTAIALMDEALQLGQTHDAVLRWVVGIGLAGLPIAWGQAERAILLLRTALADPGLMRWQQLFGQTMLAGLLQDVGHSAEARKAFAAAKVIDPEIAPDLFALFMDRRARCEARP